jgi:hypothetical protein
VNQTTSPATVTETGAVDPAANGWNLGTGADPVPASIGATSAGYGTEIQWNLNTLNSEGVLIPGHHYRFYFIVHDGDQNKTGGDCGQALFDFIYRGPVTVGGTVYEDVKDTGSYSAGDTGIGGVGLTLTGTTAFGQTVTAATTTAADGSYTFTTDSTGTLLTAGTYQVSETPPAGYLKGAATAGTVNGSADGTVMSQTTIGSVVLSQGQNGVNYNFGNLKPVTISGLVYQDTNQDSLYESGEPGIAGVTVTLSGTNDQSQSITATTTTVADGTYNFSTDSQGNVLRPGTYQITVTQPSNYLPGAANVGTVNGTTDGTVVSPTNIGSVVMAEGQAGINYDFGEWLPSNASISGYVYVDTNGDRVMDNGETGSGVPVMITLTGTTVSGKTVNLTMMTTPAGYYSFANLMAGTYTVTEGNLVFPLVYEWANVGTINGTSIGQMQNTNTLSQIQLTTGAAGINYDFADILAGS